jgi:hypothetical protein
MAALIGGSLWGAAGVVVGGALFFPYLIDIIRSYL